MIEARRKKGMTGGIRKGEIRKERRKEEREGS
jgi:hypothetical protein